MLSKRCVIVISLIATVLLVGLSLLPSPFVQKADAQSQDSCDYYIEQCELYWNLAHSICRFYGSNTLICQLALDYAYDWCRKYECQYCWCA